MTRLRTHLLPALAALLILVLLSACGRQKEDAEVSADTPSGPQIMEVKITGSNFYDYFDYKEYPSYATDEDGNITACNLSYGFSLREGYVAADDPEHKDTLKVSFTAEGVSQYGEFNVDFQTLRFEGSVYSEERESVSATLDFWPKGGRTVSYPYGTLSSSYIITLRSFSVTSVSGSIFLRVR